MIFTNCGLLGDMFLCLPVLSWYYKTYGEKVIFGVADHFPYAKDAEALLRMQECIEDVVYFKYDDSVCTARTAENLGKYHIPKSMFADTPYANHEVVSLGFHKWPNKYLPAFYAEEWGMGVDYDFKLNYGEPNHYYQEAVIKVDKFDAHKLDHINVPALGSGPMVTNLQLAAGAGELITFTTGFSIMATLARIPITIYQPMHLVEHHKMYFDINGGIKWRFL